MPLTRLFRLPPIFYLRQLGRPFLFSRTNSDLKFVRCYGLIGKNGYVYPMTSTGVFTPPN
jgi:hypothetical protein